MHSMRAFCVGVAAVLLGSCSSVGTYVEPADGAPVATLVGEDPSLFEGLDPLRTVSTTWFVRVDEHSLSRSAWSGYPNELRVVPGPHEVEVGGSVEQRARVLARDKAVFQAVFEAGRTYHVTTQLKAGGGVEIVMETSDTATSDAADNGTAR